MAVAQDPTLIAQWCKCKKGDEEFLNYPEDGECPCGIDKHHVHCICGYVLQVG